MINIYEVIKNNNINNGQKQVMSITTDRGEHRIYTYIQMFQVVEQFVLKLKSAGIKPGDRVVIVAENSPEWNIAYLSIMASRCTAVLVDSSLPKPDIIHLINISDARCVFTSPMVNEKLDCILSKAIPVLNILSQAEPFDGHLLKIAPVVCDTIDGDEEVAFIIYSSGTTKTATGIMHTHQAMISTTEAAIKFNGLTSDEKMLVVIPNSHIYGVVTSMLGPLMLGASMHFIESVTGGNVLKAFSDYQPTVFSCVPRVFEMFEKQIVDKINSKKVTAAVFKTFFPICVNVRKKTGINLGKVIFKAIHKGFGGHVRIFCAAGAPMSSDTMRFYYGVGLNLFLNYGLTETNVPIIANNFENYTIGSCGKPYPNIDIKLVSLDENGNNEIYIKSPYMMKGYFRDEEATASAFEDGWFKTGDIGKLNEQGDISIVGRCKDNIVLSTGKKVTPDDIEAGYQLIPGVKELVICGVPTLDGSYDETYAFVVRDTSDAFTKEAIQKAIYEKGATLSQYMKITQIQFVDEIPKTSLQKPKRYLLKSMAMERNAIIENMIAFQTQEKEERDVQDTLIQLIQNVHKTDTVISSSTRVFEDVGLDSLNGIELDLLIEETFGKSIAHCFSTKTTVAQMVLELEKPTVSAIDVLFNKKFPVEKDRFDYFLFKFYSGLIRWVYKVEVKGLENLPQINGYIICPNHQTNFDFLWVTTKFGKNQFQKLGCMAKKELFNHSLSSKLLSRVCGMIPVDRENHNSQSVALCKQKLKEGWNLLIYPEGTRTKNGEIGEFKKGAAMIAVTENVPIVPVKIKGGFEIFPAGRKLPKLFDFKNMRRCRIEVAFATPISGFNMDIESLNDKLRAIVTSM
ncbi:MAG: AMP-binding protein [Oscillospiraceae bacterium]